MSNIKTTSGELNDFRSLTVNSTAQAVSATPGGVFGFNIVNKHSAAIYVKIYNKAAAGVDPATDVPIKTIQVAASGSLFQAPVWKLDDCSIAISVRCVTDVTDTGTTAPATLPIIEIKYA